MKNIKIITLLLISICIWAPSQAQQKDTTHSAEIPINVGRPSPFVVNYWVTGGVIAAGLVGDYYAIPRIKNKSSISDQELDNLDRTDMSGIDRWALQQKYANSKNFAKISDYSMSAWLVVAPFTLLCDKPMRKDWLKIFAMYYECQTITFSIYNYSFLGPTFMNRYRPTTYYADAPKSDRTSGYDRSSFYSGHVASTAAASFFMAKVYSEYHPDLTVGGKILLYGIASIPPLAISYMRVEALAHFPSDCLVGFGVGAFCGILTPILHHHCKNNNVSFGVFSSSQGSGLSMNWHPGYKN